MTTGTRVNTTPKSAKGKARFDLQGDGEALSVHVDRQGFRRLLETLERLAETGESQTFEKSGRGRPRTAAKTRDESEAVARLVFHIESGDGS